MLDTGYWFAGRCTSIIPGRSGTAPFTLRILPDGQAYWLPYKSRYNFGKIFEKWCFIPLLFDYAGGPEAPPAQPMERHRKARASGAEKVISSSKDSVTAVYFPGESVLMNSLASNERRSILCLSGIAEVFIPERFDILFFPDNEQFVFFF